VTRTADQATTPAPAGASPVPAPWCPVENPLPESAQAQADHDNARLFYKAYGPDELRDILRWAALALHWHGGELPTVWAAEVDNREDSELSGFLGLALSAEGARAVAQEHLRAWHANGGPSSGPGLAWTTCEDGFTASHGDHLFYAVQEAEVRP
jgi:hypothetical protein